MHSTPVSIDRFLNEDEVAELKEQSFPALSRLLMRYHDSGRSLALDTLSAVDLDVVRDAWRQDGSQSKPDWYEFRQSLAFGIASLLIQNSQFRWVIASGKEGLFLAVGQRDSKLGEVVVSPFEYLEARADDQTLDVARTFVANAPEPGFSERWTREE